MSETAPKPDTPPVHWFKQAWADTIEQYRWVLSGRSYRIGDPTRRRRPKPRTLEQRIARLAWNNREHRAWVSRNDPSLRHLAKPERGPLWRWFLKDVYEEVEQEERERLAEQRERLNALRPK